MPTYTVLYLDIDLIDRSVFLPTKGTAPCLVHHNLDEFSSQKFHLSSPLKAQSSIRFTALGHGLGNTFTWISALFAVETTVKQHSDPVHVPASWQSSRQSWACTLRRCYARSHTNKQIYTASGYRVFRACSGSPRIITSVRLCIREQKMSALPGNGLTCNVDAFSIIGLVVGYQWGVLGSV